MIYSILLPGSVCQRPVDQCEYVAKPLSVIVFCCPGVSVRRFWIIGALKLVREAFGGAIGGPLADHFGLHGPKSMKMEGTKLSKICIDSMRLLNWMKYKRLQNHCVLQYSVALGWLSEAIGSKQKWCKTIAIYNILLPGAVCQRPSSQS